MNEYERPKGSTVSQNHPNSPSIQTAIQFQVRYNSMIDLEIYNLEGARVYHESIEIIST